MRAQMRDNLVERYKKVMPDEFDEDIGEFLEEIEGCVVDLVFTAGDAFEKKDNNIWLPDCLWDEI